MEREVAITGIGGQGVQLAAQVIARAAVHENRHVMMLGTYGGAMRGGNTDSTLVVGDAPLSAAPIVSRFWSALVMHPAYWEPVRRKLRPNAVVVVNASLFDANAVRESHRVFDVPATQIASDLGGALAASLVLAAAYARVTNLVGIDSLVAAMRESVPIYRSQHLEINERARRAGFDAAPADAAPAWAAVEGAA